MPIPWTKFDSFAFTIGGGGIPLAVPFPAVALTNTEPDATTNTVLADISEISGGGYTTGGLDVPSPTWTQSSSDGLLAGDDLTFTASGGPFDPFQFVVLYNHDGATNPLMAYGDLGRVITLDDTQDFKIEWDNNAGDGLIMDAF